MVLKTRGCLVTGIIDILSSLDAARSTSNLLSFNTAREAGLDERRVGHPDLLNDLALALFARLLSTYLGDSGVVVSQSLFFGASLCKLVVQSLTKNRCRCRMSHIDRVVVSLLICNAHLVTCKADTLSSFSALASRGTLFAAQGVRNGPFLETILRSSVSS